MSVAEPKLVEPATAAADGQVRRGGVADWCVVLLLMAALVFSFVDRLGLALLVDPIRADLGVSDAQIGLLQGLAFGLFFAVIGVPMGWIADVWSRKGVVMLGVAVWSVATAACGFAAGFPELLLARIVVGTGEAALSPAGWSIIHDRFPRRLLGRAVSLFQAGSVLGAGLAMLITGAVYHAFQAGAGASLPLIAGHRPWQQTFVAIALPGLLFLVLLSLMREPARLRSPAEVTGTDAKSAVGALLAERRLYGPLFLGMSCVILTSYALVSWAPPMLGRTFGWSPAVVGARYGLVVLMASPVGLLTGGWLVDRLGAKGVVNAHVRAAAFASLLGLPAALLLPLARSPELTLAALAVLHFAVSFPMGLVPAFLQLHAPAAARARLSGFYVMTINVVGLGAGPTLVGAFSSGLGAHPNALRHALSLVVVPAMGLAVALLGWLAWRTRRSLAI